MKDNKKSKRENKLQLFQDQSIRTHWDEDKGKWFFSIQDIAQVLTDSKDIKQYIKRMRSRDSALNSNWGTICTPLKMIAADGKMREVQTADTEGVLRIIQSIPSPKAEPFKLWLAKVGYERIEETEDPELAFDRAMETYLAKGYSKEWINQRIKSIEVRKELTDEWNERGVKRGLEYAILTNELTKAWAGKDVKDYKKFKDLKKENLRDNMSNLELVLNMLAEVSTTEISKVKQPKGLEENKNIAQKGGSVAKKARLEIEEQTEKPVVTSKNAKGLLNNPDNKEIEN